MLGCSTFPARRRLALNNVQFARYSGVIEVIMVLRGENGTAAFPGKSRNRDGFARSQAFQVLFLWVHDWIPLGRLNDVAAVRSQDRGRRLVTVTLIQSVPWTIGLCFSVLNFRQPYPDWLYDWLVISYGLLFIGQIRAWWIPYLFRPEPERVVRYQAFANCLIHLVDGRERSIAIANDIGVSKMEIRGEPRV